MGTQFKSRIWKQVSPEPVFARGALASGAAGLQCGAASPRVAAFGLCHGLQGRLVLGNLSPCKEVGTVPDVEGGAYGVPTTLWAPLSSARPP